MTAEQPFARILVTGCGGDIGQSVAKLLRTLDSVQYIAGCDLHADHAGPTFFDSCAIVPRADHADYPGALVEVARAHAIDMLIPTSEAEILRLTDEPPERIDIPVLSANAKAIRIGLDKLATADHLGTLGLRAPWTTTVGENPPRSIPCLLKKRHGQGGKGLVLVENDELVAHYAASRAGDLWQELLLPDDQEYTCGVYRTRRGETRTLALRRKLQGGLTGSGVVVEDASIDAYLLAVAAGLDLSGSINVQLRLTEQGPVAFEINPRFSSTVLFRHLLGFRDLLWSLQEASGAEPDRYEGGAPAGTRFYRGSHEIVVPPEAS